MKDRIHVKVLYESGCYPPGSSSLQVIFKYDSRLVERVRRFGYWRRNQWTVPRRDAREFGQELMRWERDGLAWVHADGPSRNLLGDAAFNDDV